MSIEHNVEYDGATGELIREWDVEVTDVPETVTVEIDVAALASLSARMDKATGVTAAVLRDLLATLQPSDSGHGEV